MLAARQAGHTSPTHPSPSAPDINSSDDTACLGPDPSPHHTSHTPQNNTRHGRVARTRHGTTDTAPAASSSAHHIAAAATAARNVGAHPRRSPSEITCQHGTGEA